jgi:hypothetical protein
LGKHFLVFVKFILALNQLDLSEGDNVKIDLTPTSPVLNNQALAEKLRCRTPTSPQEEHHPIIHP